MRTGIGFRRVVLLAAAAGLGCLSVRPAAQDREMALERRNPVPETDHGGQTLRGRVLGPDGPVAGAAVWVASRDAAVLSERPDPCEQDSGDAWADCEEAFSRFLIESVLARRGEARTIARTVSGADGSFVLGPVAKGSYAVWAEVSGKLFGVRLPVSSGRQEVEVRVRPGVILHGRTVTDGGKPLAGASLTAVFLDHTRFFDAVAGPDGSFAIGPIPFGNYSVVASAPGFVAVAHGTTGFQPDIGVLSLLTPRRVAGKVLRAGESTRGALVRLEARSLELTTEAGEGGAFSFSGVPPGSYSLRAASGLLKADEVLELPPGQDVLDVVVRLESCAAITGTVRNRSGGPIAGATVGSSRVRTGGDGTYRFLTCETGPQSFVASVAGYFPDEREVHVSAGRTVEVDFTLEPASPLAGVMVDEDGEPVPGAVLDALLSGTVKTPDAIWGQATTARDGSFSVGPLPQGSFDLTISHSSFPRLKTTVSSPVTTARFVLPRGREVFGTVRDAQGSPVVGARVMAFPSGEDRGELYMHGADAKLDASSEPLGRFRIGGLAAGRHVLSAQFPPDGQEVAIEFDAKEQVTGPVDLQFPPSSSIAGKIVGVSGRPISNMKVIASRRLPDRDPLDPRRDRRWVEAVSQADGSFEIGGLEPGTYRVWPQGDSDGPRREGREVGAGATNLRFVLDDSKARGRVVEKSGKPITRFEIDGASYRAPDGAFEISLAGIASDGLRFGAEGFAPTWRVLASPVGSDVDLGNVVLEKGRPVTGKVIDARSGAAVAGARVSVSAIEKLGTLDIRHGGNHGAVESGPDGTFTLPAVGPFPVALVVEHEGHCWFARRLESDEGAVVVRLDPGAAVEGAVGPRAFNVAARTEKGLEYTFESGGRFRFEALPSGKTTFWTSEGALKVVDVPKSGTVHLDLVPTGGVHLVLQLPEGLAPTLIPGTVPLPSTRVELMTGMLPVLERDGQGFKRLSPGSYTLVLSREHATWTEVFAQPLQVRSSAEQRVSVPMPDSFPGVIRE